MSNRSLPSSFSGRDTSSLETWMIELTDTFCTIKIQKRQCTCLPSSQNEIKKNLPEFRGNPGIRRPQFTPRRSVCVPSSQDVLKRLEFQGTPGIRRPQTKPRILVSAPRPSCLPKLPSELYTILESPAEPSLEEDGIQGQIQYPSFGHSLFPSNDLSLRPPPQVPDMSRYTARLAGQEWCDTMRSTSTRAKE
ncbi:unnamed protein product [Cyprideis torosa]|uniref:Uncharacterized protein n=1 Tax=Cyprideis torosa TaxID=163714 RepID=A0A7R8WHY9_9CRUS|nr:unnamed protein product [Cyprideis torosa]CAG0900047.1 unnamed protein product [Cyprideis torosa]